jgi:hypothetical protein
MRVARNNHVLTRDVDRAAETGMTAGQREHHAVVAAVLVAFGAALAALAVHSGWGRDFASFYGSAAALATGSDPYRSGATGGAININLPHVTALLVPLTYLPFDVAFSLWQAAQLAAWGALLLLLCRESPSVSRPEFVAAAVLFPGTLAQIAQGQWGFVLAWLLGMAWVAHRRHRETEAGLWIGVACALKPFVGLLAVLYARQSRFRGAAVAALTVSGAVAAGVLVLGPDLYARWATATSEISWAGYPSNASLLGFAERTVPSGIVNRMWSLMAAALGAATVIASSRRVDDRITWTLVLVAALLISPLGWLYYGWIVAAPLLSMPRWSPLLKAGLLLLWIPPGWFPALSTATLGLLVLWSALLMQAGRREGRLSEAS